MDCTLGNITPQISTGPLLRVTSDGSSSGQNLGLFPKDSWLNVGILSKESSLKPLHALPGRPFNCQIFFFVLIFFFF